MEVKQAEIKSTVTKLFNKTILVQPYNGNYNAYEFRLEVLLNSQSEKNNSSNITINQYAKGTNGSYSEFSTPKQKIVQNEIIRANVTVSAIPKSEVLIATWTGDVTHNDNGNYTLNITSSYNPNTSSYGYVPKKNSISTGNITLPKIARAATATCADFYIESSTTINVDPYSSSLKYTIEYTFGSATGTIVTKGSDKSYGWTPTDSTFYDQVLNAKQKTGTLTCKTYSGDDLLGTKTSTFTARVDEIKNIPTVSLSVVDSNSTTVALTGDSNKLVKYFSNAEATITATPKNSATIESYQLNDASASQVTTINNVEVNSFTAKATDSRGITGISPTVTKTMINYIKLGFTSLSIERTGPTTDQLRLNAEGNFFNSSFGKVTNTISIKIRWKENDEWSDYANIIPTINDNKFTLSDVNVNTLFNDQSFNYQKAYVFEVIVEDKLMSVQKTLPLKKGQPVFSIGENFAKVYGDLYVTGKINVDVIYPVGSIYISVNNTNPTVIFGGTWEQIKDRFLLACGDTYKNGEIGGEATHTLTNDETPAHVHIVKGVTEDAPAGSSLYTVNKTTRKGEYSGNIGNTTSVGGNQPHNNMPPYIAVYIWERIA